MKKSLIIIPVYNEEKNITEVLADIREKVDFADILVINDCSTDNTVEKLRESGVNYVSLPFNLGYSAALQTGFKFAVDKDYDYIIQFDGDGQHKASEIGKLFNYIQKKRSDIIIGSRFRDNKDYPHPLFRKVGSKMFELLIRIFCRKRITDPTSGFQILQRRVFEKYARMFNYPQFPDANLLIEMMLSGFVIDEVPVSMNPREHGVSMHSGIISPIKYMIKVFFSIFISLISFQFKFLKKRSRKNV